MSEYLWIVHLGLWIEGRVNYKLWTANYESWNVDSELSFEACHCPLWEPLEGSFATFWMPFGASWKVLGAILEPFASFWRQLRSFLGHLGVAWRGLHDFGSSYQRFWVGFWGSKSKKKSSKMAAEIRIVFSIDLWFMFNHFLSKMEVCATTLYIIVDLRVTCIGTLQFAQNYRNLQ